MLTCTQLSNFQSFFLGGGGGWRTCFSCFCGLSFGYPVALDEPFWTVPVLKQVTHASLQLETPDMTTPIIGG